MRHPTDELTALADGALAPERAHEVRRHLEGCESCRALSARIAGAVAALGALPPPPAPSPWFGARLEARLAREDLAGNAARSPVALLSRLASRWRVAAPVGALAAAAAVAVIVVRTRGADERELAAQLDLLADYEVVANLDTLASPDDAEIAANLDVLQAERVLR